MKVPATPEQKELDELAAQILELQLAAPDALVARPLAEWGIEQAAKAAALFGAASGPASATALNRAAATWHWAQARLVRNQLAALAAAARQ